VLADPNIDALVISVPHHLHKPLTIKAMEAGKHVMCDKPIATTVADADAMIAASARTGRRLNINYPSRFTPKARRARALIREGLLGKIFAITIIGMSAKPEEYWSQGWSRVTSTDWRRSKAKAGGGVTLMNSSHYMDLAFSLTGLHAVSIAGMAGTFNSPAGVEVEDLSTGIARLNNGGILSVLSSSCYIGGIPSAISIAGTNGQIEMSGTPHDILRVFVADAKGHDLKANEWVNLQVSDKELEGYSFIMEQFALAVAEGGPMPVPAEDARHTQACILGFFGENNDLPPGYCE
jgi:predicted dehydrogenase